MGLQRAYHTTSKMYLPLRIYLPVHHLPLANASKEELRRGYSATGFDKLINVPN